MFSIMVVYIYRSEDRTPPKIQFQDERITYTQGEEKDNLIYGVTAVDKKDGDVTQSLMVESVYQNDDGETATVIYVARDTKNNIGKAYRIVDFKKDSETWSESEDEEVDTDDKQIENQPEVENLIETDQQPTNFDLPEESPRITLRNKQVNVNLGESINRIAYVESITDDKDSEEDLWMRIQIKGDTFDQNTAGSYEQIYYVTDSDGNKSNEETLIINVQ